MNSFARRSDQLMYKIFGPTTNHLRHEFYLLVSLTLLIMSSLQALYKGSLGIRGNYEFVLLGTLWLSRHLVLRCLCTWDNSTNRSPTIGGVLAHWITSHVMAGQYFDRPDPQVVAKQVGTPHADEGRTGATISSFFLPSIRFSWQLVTVRILEPFISLYESLWGLLKGKKGRRSQTSLPGRISHRVQESSTTNPTITMIHSYWTKLWSTFGPSLQMIIPVSTMAFYLWYLMFAQPKAEKLYALTMNTRGPDEATSVKSKPYGAYQKVEKPHWSQVLFYMSCGGTLISIILYGRVVLPIADLVAGSNVLKAVRNESRAGGKQSKSKFQRENTDLSWAEQYRSIVGENRFRLIWYCPEGASLLALSKVFFPIGITTPLRGDGSYQNQYSLITPDRGSAIMAISSVLVITFSLLLAQAVTLNRSYLGIMGYIAGEWTVMDSADPSLAGTKASQWDPRRRYKKGDLIVQNSSSFGRHLVYKATSNSPEGRPFDLYLRATHEFFRNEMGHTATSNAIVFATLLQLSVILTLIVMILYYHIVGYHFGSLLWTLVANLFAAYGMISVSMPNYSEVGKLAQALSE